jgi:hypothetical protein
LCDETQTPKHSLRLDTPEMRELSKWENETKPIILIIVADVTVDSSELYRDVFAGVKDTGACNCSVRLVVFGKCENKWVMCWKLCNNEAKISSVAMLA